MNKKKSYDLVIGLFVFTGMIIVAILIMKFGDIRNPARSYELTVTFNNVGGLVEDAPVRYAGVVAGRVKDILPGPEYDIERRVRVVLSLEKWVTVREKDEIFITSANILGDKLVEIRPIDKSAPKWDGREEIRGKDFEEVMTLASELIGQIIDDQTRRNIKSIAQNLSDLTDEDMQQAIRNNLENWNKVALRMNQFFDTATKQELSGLISNLSEGSRNFASTSQSLSEMSEELRQFIVDGGDTIMHTFVEFKSAAESVRDLADTVSRIASKADAGEGFVGQLLTESEIYEDLVSLIKGLEKWGPLKYYKYKTREQRELERKRKREE